MNFRADKLAAMTDQERAQALVSKMVHKKYDQTEGTIHIHVPALGGTTYKGVCGAVENVVSFPDWDMEHIPKERICDKCLEELEAGQAISYIGGLFS